MSDFLAAFCFFPSRRLYFGMAYARRSKLGSWGHSHCDSESVHDQWYEDGTERWTSEYTCHFLPCIDHFRMSCGHSLVVDWTPRCCYVLQAKSFLELTDLWSLFWGWVLCRCKPQTRAIGIGSRFWFHVKLVFPSLPHKLLPVPETDSLPVTLVASSNQDWFHRFTAFQCS